MRMLLFALSLLLVVGGLVVAGRLGHFAGRMPADLGVRDGRLKAPSAEGLGKTVRSKSP